MTSRSAVEKAIDTHWIAGLNFWTRATDSYVYVTCQNPLGAVEYRVHMESGDGTTILHAPSLIHGWADDIYHSCPVQAA